MHKYPVLQPKEIIKILEKKGFIEIRSRGSHKQYKKGNLLVTIPISTKALKLETLKSILRQARISIDELEKIIRK